MVQIHGCFTRPKIRVRLVRHVAHGCGAYECIARLHSVQLRLTNVGMIIHWVDGKVNHIPHLSSSGRPTRVRLPTTLVMSRLRCDTELPNLTKLSLGGEISTGLLLRRVRDVTVVE